MSVNPVSAPLAALQAVPTGDGKRLALQMALLQKSLQVQQQQAVEVSNQTEGKGRLLDIRI